jgi:hypothetical protein
MLVTLFHNKPLLNEPGFSEKHRSFIPYNNIIRFKNLQISLLRNLNPEKLDANLGHCKVFFHIYKKYIDDRKTEILNYIKLLKDTHDKEEIKVNVYNMKCLVDYETLENEFIKTLN